MITSAERAAWAAIDVVKAEEAAHYLSSGEAHLTKAVARQMERDYRHALTRLFRELVTHLRLEDAPEWPHGLLDEPTLIGDTVAHQLRSIAFEEAEELLLSGEPEQAYGWFTSQQSRFEGQSFRRTEVEAWAANRGLSGRADGGVPSTLNPKEKTALYRVIAVLAAAYGLDLSRHSTAAARVLEEAAKSGIDISRRTLEKHLRAVHQEMDRLRSSPDD